MAHTWLTDQPQGDLSSTAADDRTRLRWPDLAGRVDIGVGAAGSVRFMVGPTLHRCCCSQSAVVRQANKDLNGFIVAFIRKDLILTFSLCKKHCKLLVRSKPLSRTLRAPFTRMFPHSNLNFS